MIVFLLQLLMVYFIGMFIFAALTMFISVIFARARFADPEFKSDLTASYPPGAFSAMIGDFWANSFGYLNWPRGWTNRDEAANRTKTNERPPVVLIHGWYENQSFWRWMRKRLGQDPSRRMYSLNLWPMSQRIDFFREQLAQRVNHALADSGHDKVTLIGHSMGGLVARAYIKEYGAEHVERLITLGTPHGGTNLALIWGGKPVRQMRPNSAFLANLDTDPNIRRVDVHTIASVHDNIVVPFDNALMRNSHQHLLYGVGHGGLLRSEAVARILRTLLQSEAVAPPSDPLPEENEPQKTEAAPTQQAETTTTSEQNEKPAEDAKAASDQATASEETKPEETKKKKAPARRKKSSPVKKEATEKESAKKGKVGRPRKKAATSTTKRTSSKKPAASEEDREQAKKQAKDQLLKKLKEK